MSLCSMGGTLENLGVQEKWELSTKNQDVETFCCLPFAPLTHVFSVEEVCVGSVGSLQRNKGGCGSLPSTIASGELSVKCCVKGLHSWSLNAGFSLFKWCIVHQQCVENVADKKDLEDMNSKKKILVRLKNARPLVDHMSIYHLPIYVYLNLSISI